MLEYYVRVLRKVLCKEGITLRYYVEVLCIVFCKGIM